MTILYNHRLINLKDKKVKKKRVTNTIDAIGIEMYLQQHPVLNIFVLKTCFFVKFFILQTKQFRFYVSMYIN